MKPAKRLVVGCGYLGSRVAARWQAAGHAVWVVTRSQARAELLAAAGHAPIVGDVADASTLIDWPAFDSVLFAVGYDRSAGRTIEDVYARGVENVAAALPSPPECFTYISTTGVYGDAGGADLNEDTPPAPRRPGGIASLAAECALAQSKCGPHGVVLRLAGIYGPGRIPNRDLLLANDPIPAAPQSWLNLIHIDDAVEAVLAAERFAKKSPERLPRTFNISDGCPVLREDFYGELARLVGAPPPSFEAPEEAANRRAGSNKRISNARMTSELQLVLTRPSYREGLLASLDSLD